MKDIKCPHCGAINKGMSKNSSRHCIKCNWVIHVNNFEEVDRVVNRSSKR